MPTYSSDSAKISTNNNGVQSNSREPRNSTRLASKATERRQPDGSPPFSGSHLKTRPQNVIFSSTQKSNAKPDNPAKGLRKKTNNNELDQYIITNNNIMASNSSISGPLSRPRTAPARSSELRAQSDLTIKKKEILRARKKLEELMGGENDKAAEARRIIGMEILSHIGHRNNGKLTPYAADRLKRFNFVYEWNKRGEEIARVRDGNATQEIEVSSFSSLSLKDLKAYNKLINLAIQPVPGEAKIASDSAQLLSATDKIIKEVSVHRMGQQNQLQNKHVIKSTASDTKIESSLSKEFATKIKAMEQDSAWAGKTNQNSLRSRSQSFSSQSQSFRNQVRDNEFSPRHRANSAISHEDALKTQQKLPRSVGGSYEMG